MIQKLQIDPSGLRFKAMNCPFNNVEKWPEIYSRGVLASRRAFLDRREPAMFRLYRNAGPLHAPHSGGRFSSCYRIRKTGNTKTLESSKDYIKKKGGRPPKAVKKDQLLGVKCTLIERRAIEAKARSAGLSVSEYLRELGLTGKIDMRQKAFPKEVLGFTGTLNHLAANMNQVAKKRNQNDVLNALERAKLQQEVVAIKQLAKDIKSYLE